MDYYYVEMEGNFIIVKIKIKKILSKGCIAHLFPDVCINLTEICLQENFKNLWGSMSLNIGQEPGNFAESFSSRYCVWVILTTY